MHAACAAWRHLAGSKLLVPSSPFSTNHTNLSRAAIAAQTLGFSTAPPTLSITKIPGMRTAKRLAVNVATAFRSAVGLRYFPIGFIGVMRRAKRLVVQRFVSQAHCRAQCLDVMHMATAWAYQQFGAAWMLTHKLSSVHRLPSRCLPVFGIVDAPLRCDGACAHAVVSSSAGHAATSVRQRRRWRLAGCRRAGSAACSRTCWQGAAAVCQRDRLRTARARLDAAGTSLAVDQAAGESAARRPQARSKVGGGWTVDALKKQHMPPASCMAGVAVTLALRLVARDRLAVGKHQNRTVSPNVVIGRPCRIGCSDCCAVLLVARLAHERSGRLCGSRRSGTNHSYLCRCAWSRQSTAAGRC